MKFVLSVAVVTASALPFAAAAQSMPGMTMPMPAEPAPAKAKPRAPVPKRYTLSPPRPPARTAADPQVRPVASPIPTSAPAPASAMPDSTMPDMTMPPASPAGPAMSMPMEGHSAMPGGAHDAMTGMDMPGMSGNPTAFGEGSGTARLPGGEGAMHGVHVAAGDWMLMLHGYAWGVYTDQGGPRGGNEAFVQSMAMIEGTRDFGGARLQLRSMLSLEPLMGARGYPNLFATGETADGVHPLVDRQHPHDLFMEASARLDVDVAKGTSLFVYGGPVAEPALGPSAFMHRGSAQYLPDSPITHHWFDSTHISYGVVTGGLSTPHWQIEASAFRGREPDQHRWDIETPKLDSWSARLTWTPTPAWAVQVSHGFIRSGEQLEPDFDEHRTTASVHYAARGVFAMLGYAIKDKSPGRALTALLAEANWDVGDHHTLFARVENVNEDELFPDPASALHDRAFRISKLEGGYAYRLRVAGPVLAALGGSLGVYAKPAALDAAYSAFPISFSLFAKLSLGH